MPEITLSSPDGEFSAYLTGDTGPGIVLAQEIFGVNDVMRETADQFAKQGYKVICPDLFWRQEPGIQITDKTEKDWEKAFSLYQGFDEDKGIEDLKLALNFLRDQGCKKVGSVGYCLGGKLSYLMATRSNADCNVSYYGVGIDAALSEADNIKNPLILHIAEEDGFVDKAAQEKIKQSLTSNHITIHSYTGVDHAFARIEGINFDEKAAQSANERTSTFFEEHLK